MNFSDFFYSLAGIINEMSPYILLGFLIAGLLHVFVRPEAMTRHLAGPGLGPVVRAALLGIPLPLCSCGVLPTAVALRRQGASKGATTSFLIATPQTGVDSIAATYSLLGLPFAVLRPLAALLGASLGGWAVTRFDRNDAATSAAVTSAETSACSCGHASDEASGCSCGGSCCSSSAGDDYAGMPLTRRLLEAVKYGLVDMVASVGKWLVIGLVVAALITVLVPDELFLSLSRYPLLAMLVMILVAIPMYICATGSIPIAMSLMIKGLSPGVAFVLLMAGPAANFASVMILNRTIGRRSTAIYIGSVVVTAMAVGLLIDYLLPSAWFKPQALAHVCCHGEGEGFTLFSTACSIVLTALLVYAAVSRRSLSRKHNTETSKTSTDMKQQFKVTGMSCTHCQSTVVKALSSLPGVVSVDVNLSTGIATVEGDVDPEKVKEAIYNAGFNLAE